MESIIGQVVKRFMTQAQYDRWRINRLRTANAGEINGIVKQQQSGELYPDSGPESAIRRSLTWIGQAQDSSLTADGGVARHFSFVSGWSASYPETTGYIVPTMLREGAILGDPTLLERARRMLDWLVSIQFEDGGFQGGMIDQTPKVPVTFNTGQILIGLAAGAKVFDEPRYHDAMRRAANFLATSQDADGCWRQHPTPFAARGDKAYETHVAWGLFEADRVMPGQGFGDAGRRQVDWALTRQQDNGWFADNCLDNPEAPLTHTIGYVLRGVLEAYRLSGHEPYLRASVKTADALLAVQKSSGRIAGRLDAGWNAAVPWACCTGNVQIALCWFLLAEITGRADYLDAAERSCAFVRRTMPVSGDPAIDGAVMGSWPLAGDYGKFEALNWAAKFAIDANRMLLCRQAGQSVLDGMY